MNPHAKCCCGKDPKDPLDPDLTCCVGEAENWVGSVKCPNPAASATHGALAPGCSISLSVMLESTTTGEYKSIDAAGNAPRYQASTATNCYSILVKSDGGSLEVMGESGPPSKSALDVIAQSRRGALAPGGTLRAYPDETPTFTYFTLEWDAAGVITFFQIPPTQLFTVPFSAGQDITTRYTPSGGSISFGASCITSANCSTSATVYPFGWNTPWTININASFTIQHAECPDVLAAMRDPRHIREMTPELARILGGGRMA